MFTTRPARKNSQPSRLPPGSAGGAAIFGGPVLAAIVKAGVRRRAGVAAVAEAGGAPAIVGGVACGTWGSASGLGVRGHGLGWVLGGDPALGEAT